jgi:glyoxylase-like metal-dependent hydrolase (beta-lactamase superfamily II)
MAKIIALSEGSFTIDQTKKFIPFNKDTDDLQLRSTGSLLVEIQPFVIIAEKDIIVLDTGLGFENTHGVMQIHQNLINNGIQPAEVTKVLLSHLHKDHAGGIAHNNVLSFPNAKYYVNSKELDYAFEKGKPSYETGQFSQLQNSPNVILLNERGIIDDYIEYETSGAHCPYHTVFWIRENDQKIFFGGDVAPQLQQMKTRFVAKYDFDGKRCMELRNLWWQQGQKEKWTFLFYHDISSPEISL